jgi:hypothetical protein
MAIHANSTAVPCLEGNSPPDAILAIIREYHAAMQALADLDLGDDAYFPEFLKTCEPIRLRILDCKSPATTLAGAHACVHLARQEYEVADTDMIPHLLDAALGFFTAEEASR